ncbi:type III-A CRISPR-associated RAMP protein Csm3 [uncultured Brachyspira sp.]|uniref:type III-A CRISPR-associated RAMP protein Csm3 n=1 Tax=uncultured Brachyspira sp. TaxID=221953 RepID=UPI00262CDB59|nr:type III-A CRISPR-associated RAMP protein Csm3 [uncultured Brachyspira sp.]
MLLKFKISANMTLLTGMHIGASNDFSPIGAIDSPVIKDPITKQPIIPGSSIKGKLRTLMAKLISNNNKDYKITKCDDDPEEIKVLFGSSEHESRLQFYDLFLKNPGKLEQKNLDFIYTESKFENSIYRITLEANPRQLERIPAGAVFNFQFIYNFCYTNNENVDNDVIKKDFEFISNAIKALQLDYLGGSGSRGYGKVLFNKFKVINPDLKNYNIDKKEFESINSDKMRSLIEESLKDSELFIKQLIEAENKKTNN